MPIIVTCEDCSMKHRVKDAAAGKRITCRGCGRTLLVDAPVASTLSGTNAAGSDDDSSGVLSRGDERKLERKPPTTQAPATSVQESPPFGKRLFGC